MDDFGRGCGKVIERSQIIDLLEAKRCSKRNRVKVRWISSTLDVALDRQLDPNRRYDRPAAHQVANLSDSISLVV